MKEQQVILRAFVSLCEANVPAALATVVRVAGSSYRRPGARMLVAMDGRTWGGVSGGCLERDVARRARSVIESGDAIVCRFDTSDELEESDAVRGVALGCAGVIDLFIERVSATEQGPFSFIQQVQTTRQSNATATSLQSASGVRRYTAGDAPRDVAEILRQVPSAGLQECESGRFFFEVIRPSQSLVLFGGGSDVVPVVQLAKTLGWHVSVIASHANVGYRERFAPADVVTMGTEADLFGEACIEPDAAIVLMTHNYLRDLLLLRDLVNRPHRYLGILGPRRRAERLVLESQNLPAQTIQKIYAPVGLDIGGDTPETIALAIVAEIQATLTGHDCRSLRDRSGPIYQRTTNESSGPYDPSACSISA